MKKIIFSLFFVLIFSCKDQTSIEKKQNYKITDIQKENSLTKGEILRFLENTFKYLEIGVSFESLDYEKIEKLVGNTSDKIELKKRIDIKNIRNINGIQNTVERFYEKDPKLISANECYGDNIFILINTFLDSIDQDIIPTKGEQLIKFSNSIQIFLNTVETLRNYLLGKIQINKDSFDKDKIKSEIEDNLSFKLTYPLIRIIDYAFSAVDKIKELKIAENEISSFIKMHIDPYEELFEKGISFFNFLIKNLEKIEKKELKIDDFHNKLKENFGELFEHKEVEKQLIENKKLQLKKLANRLN